MYDLVVKKECLDLLTNPSAAFPKCMGTMIVFPNLGMGNLDHYYHMAYDGLLKGEGFSAPGESDGSTDSMIWPPLTDVLGVPI